MIRLCSTLGISVAFYLHMLFAGMSHFMQITYAAVTDLGLKRKRNKDAYLIEKRKLRGLSGVQQDILLLGVADGMGGHACGDVASTMACDSLTGLADEGTGEPVDIEQRMEERFFQIYTVLRNYGAAEKNCADMGTTLSVLFLLSEKGLIAHVGDSRIYRLRNTTLQRLTTDHSFIQELIDKGLLSEEAAAGHPYRNKLTNVIGSGEPLEDVQTDRIDIAPGDRFLLSTDGLYGDISSEEIKTVLQASPTPQKAAEHLLHLALERGGRDNATAIVAFLE